MAPLGTLLRVPRPSDPGSYPVRPPAIGVARVHHDSMLPTLPPGTRVHVRAKPPRIGDVVLFVTANGEHGVVHRVVFCFPGFPWLVQAGDSQRERGRVAAVHRRQLVGVADLPRVPPSPQQCWAALRLLAARTLGPLGRR